MDIMAGMSSNAFFIALVQIVAIDIVLGGDNAIIIALACRNPVSYTHLTLPTNREV